MWITLSVTSFDDDELLGKEVTASPRKSYSGSRWLNVFFSGLTSGVRCYVVFIQVCWGRWHNIRLLLCIFMTVMNEWMNDIYCAMGNILSWCRTQKIKNEKTTSFRMTRKFSHLRVRTACQRIRCILWVICDCEISNACRWSIFFCKVKTGSKTI